MHNSITHDTPDCISAVACCRQHCQQGWGKKGQHSRQVALLHPLHCIMSPCVRLLVALQTERPLGMGACKCMLAIGGFPSSPPCFGLRFGASQLSMWKGLSVPWGFLCAEDYLFAEASLCAVAFLCFEAFVCYHLCAGVHSMWASLLIC